jgi:hypothetical protein
MKKKIDEKRAITPRWLIKFNFSSFISKTIRDRW